jgi:hypothetical protein
MSARNAQIATSDDYHVTTPWPSPITSGDEVAQAPTATRERRDRT